MPTPGEATPVPLLTALGQPAPVALPHSPAAPAPTTVAPGCTYADTTAALAPPAATATSPMAPPSSIGGGRSRRGRVASRAVSSPTSRAAPASRSILTTRGPSSRAAAATPEGVRGPGVVAAATTRMGPRPGGRGVAISTQTSIASIDHESH